MDLSIKSTQSFPTGVYNLFTTAIVLCGHDLYNDVITHKQCRMRVAMNELAPGNNIKIELSKDGSGCGAAIAAAIACRDAGD